MPSSPPARRAAVRLMRYDRTQMGAGGGPWGASSKIVACLAVLVGAGCGDRSSTSPAPDGAACPRPFDNGVYEGNPCSPVGLACKYKCQTTFGTYANYTFTAECSAKGKWTIEITEACDAVLDSSADGS